ncbi:MAG: 6-bladed beta-propeller [Gemmatimonadota bacterium]|nr:6-bladed beta-propeller [Gemmatimonadota bacterium]
MKLGARLCAAGAVIALGGCAAEPDAGPVGGPVPGAPLEIEAIRAMSVGVLGGDPYQEFDGVVRPFLLPDGRLVVPNSGGYDIRVFNEGGEFLEALGGRGEGPGEFMYLSAAWPRGDTVEAFDSRLRRVTRFLPDGSTEVVPIASGEYPDLGLGAGPLGRGWVLGGVVFAGHGQRDRISVHHFDRNGGHLGELVSVGGIVRYSAGNFGGPEPLSPRSVVVTDGTYLYFGDTLESVIRRTSAPGIADGEIAWEPTESPAVRDALDRVIDQAVSEAPADEASATRARHEAAPVPDELSVFWDFLVDPEGFVWIQPYDPLAHAFALGGRYVGGVGSGGAWSVIALDGQRAGSIAVADGLELTQITPTAVVGIRRDELGVESVHVHGIRRN